MVEEDTGAGEEVIGLAVIGYLPKGSGLGDGIGAPGAKRLLCFADQG